MKFTSIFTKVPSHQVFNYSPRYYNPQKEKVKERESRIRKELDMGKKEHVSSYNSRISGSFRIVRNRGNSTTSRSPKTTLIRLGTILVLVLFLIAYVTWGKVTLYGFLLLIPLYIYSKFKKQ